MLGCRSNTWVCSSEHVNICIVLQGNGYSKLHIYLGQALSLPQLGQHLRLPLGGDATLAGALHGEALHGRPGGAAGESTLLAGASGGLLARDGDGLGLQSSARGEGGGDEAESRTAGALLSAGAHHRPDGDTGLHTGLGSLQGRRFGDQVEVSGKRQRLDGGSAAAGRGSRRAGLHQSPRGAGGMRMC